MSQRPFGFGNRWMDTYSCERAAPRTPGPGEKRYHHPVIPIQSAAVPHYAQASQLYPMRTTTERDNTYRYRPGSSGLGTTTGASSPSPGGQPISIPVLHLGQSRGSSNSPTTVASYGGSGLNVQGNTEFRPGSTTSDSGEPGYRSPPYRSTLLSSTARSGTRTPVTSDQEAEVDALTNLLMRSMETRSSSGLGSSVSSTGLTATSDVSTSSPVGSLRRSNGSSTPVSQISRLQHHLGITPNSVGVSVSTANGGRASPLTNVTAATAASVTGSSSTNSPTGSTSSVLNASEHGGSVGTLANIGTGQNSCFRCRRALFPPEGSTLNPSMAAANNSNNVVTLTGALAVRLHVACFTCYRCAAPLRPDAYYHSLRRLLCPACVRDGAVETCSNCRRPIGDRVVHALGLPYHPNCFVCVVCAGRLDSKPFTIDVHGRLHCLDDFHRRYAPRCAHCGRPIAPDPGSQEARRVVSGDSNYHLECFGVRTVSQPSSIGTKLTAGVAS
ncbi:hypothetical protein CRM22_003624 [Opisthorchis felineus]|uniref:LIM zinc-binding domain-containing protein n=1 Tax=Opisthorchis felineus TaxID=147828 RepID=A0A4S2M6E7_OPIFE|nr:hypothetical protein CRM22_003624 [Opisthorchis felineus]